MNEHSRRFAPFDPCARTYGYRHRDEIRSLLKRAGELGEKESADHAGRLDAVENAKDPARTRALVVQPTAYEMAVGLSIFEPLPAVKGRWLLSLLLIDAQHRKSGFGTLLLAETERRVRKAGGHSLLVAVMPAVEASSGGFLRSKGYLPFPPAAVPSRFSDSAYYLREF